MKANWQIPLACVIQSFAIAFLNSFARTVTKYASAAQNTTLGTSGTVLIWLFFLTVPIPGVPKEKFTWLQFGGFILMIIGTLVYNEIVVIPFFGFGQSTKSNLKKQEKLKELEAQEKADDENAEKGPDVFSPDDM